MKALKTQDNFLLFEAYDIRFGKLDEHDIDSQTGEPIEKWGMYNEDGNVLLYAIDNNFEVVEFDPADKPEDYVPYKYYFIDGQFVLNEDYVEPPLPTEEQVRINTEDIAVVTQMAEDGEEAMCDMDEAYDARVSALEEQIGELQEMLHTLLTKE